jgi:hypothetical protein
MTTHLFTLSRRLDALSDEHRVKLMVLGRPVDFPAGARILRSTGQRTASGCCATAKCSSS